MLTVVWYWKCWFKYGAGLNATKKVKKSLAISWKFFDRFRTYLLFKLLIISTNRNSCRMYRSIGFLPYSFFIGLWWFIKPKKVRACECFWVRVPDANGIQRMKKSSNFFFNSSSHSIYVAHIDTEKRRINSTRKNAPSFDSVSCVFLVSGWCKWWFEKSNASELP